MMLSIEQILARRLPTLIRKIENIHNDLRDLVKKISGQNIEITKQLLLVAYHKIEEADELMMRWFSTRF